MPLTPRPAPVRPLRRAAATIGVAALLLAVHPRVFAAAPEPEWRVAAVKWDASTLGHHRAVVAVPSSGMVAHVTLPWRRRDADPAARAVIVTDAAGHRVANVRRGTLTREAGELWFEPVAGAGTYYVYYLPFQSGGRSNYPKVTYPAPADTADAAWAAAVTSSKGVDATPVAFEAVDTFNAFDPMEVIATRAEVESLLRARPGAAFLVFPEDREHPVRMARDLPRRWIQAGPTGRFSGSARPGEYFAFQLAVLALQPLSGVRVTSSALAAPGGQSLPSDAVACINTHGVDWKGEPFEKTLDVAKGEIRSIWCAVDTPRAATAGRYEGVATVSANGVPDVVVQLAVSIGGDPVPDGGANEPWKQTRLKWLNSRLGQKNEVIAPYTPLRVEGTSIRLLGRRVSLGALGLPDAIDTYFTREMTAIGSEPNPVLAAPMALVLERPDGQALSLRTGDLRFVETSEGTVRWTASASSADVVVHLEGTIEFDGFVSCRIQVTGTRDVELADVRLEMPLRKAAATYLMGLGQKGGARPSRLDWTWSVATRNQDGAWIGAVNAGLAFSLRGDNYTRPLNTNFYLQKPLALPPSWGNEGRGGVSIREHGDAVRVDAYSGRRTLRAGETQRYDVTFFVTPFHALDTDAQWRTRFYHRYAPVDTVAATGATVVNVHHATPINPWINYPFIAHREMKAYVDEAHAKGLKVKIYNTVRELSNRAYELFPLRSLGHEVFSPGPGGGFAWLQEHLGEDYIAAWFVPDLEDAAVINSGMSRWHNYYVEGMDWLRRHVGIDGVYLDDVAFDRTTMKRIKRVLTQDGHPGILDLHSANQFNQRDGYISSALLYLEHFPYVNRLWFGEYFDYERSAPDFYLTEVSGIPFGLMGEMLEGGGNPWRGLVFGMTNRMPWSETADPRPIWKAWDAFGMDGARMIGWWVDTAPVRTGRSDVLATSYAKPGRALVALASWADTDVDVTLDVDWDALGIEHARARITAASIPGFQDAASMAPGQRIPVKKGRGWLLTLEAR